MRTGSNKPYVKRFDVNGVCINPITAANPYISKDSTRRTRRDFMQKDSSSKKNTPNKRQQIIVLKEKVSFTQSIVRFRMPTRTQIVSFVRISTKIIHHERKG